MGLRTRFARVALGALTVAALQAATAQAYVYWTTFGQGLVGGGTTLARANLDGGGVANPLITGAGNPIGIAVQGNHIYWANQLDNSIGRSNLDGSGANQSFIPNATIKGYPIDLAVQGNYLYWTNGDTEVGRANLDGTDVRPHFLVFDQNAGIWGIAVDPTTIYVAAHLTVIYSAPIGGATAPSPFYTPANATHIWGLAVAGGNLYWAAWTNNDSDGEIGRINTVGTPNPNDSLITTLKMPTGVATDANELYWVDHQTNQIGRAQLSSGAALNIQPDFITTTGYPWGIAIDSQVDPTSTTVTCSPSVIAPGMADACTATVSDTASSARPTGTITFGSDTATYFNPASCTLVTHSNGTTGCTAGAVSPNAGTIPITVSYSGDAVHGASTGQTSFCAGTTKQCAGSPPPAKHCVVPRLKGKTLAQARRLLSNGHCKLGHVAKSRRSHRRLIVESTKPKAGTSLPAGASVAVKLGPAPRRNR